jgi:hypothetical protein
MPKTKTTERQLHLSPLEEKGKANEQEEFLAYFHKLRKSKFSHLHK